ncbi:GyrI-like domain-containing protein [Paenibacillus sp. MMS18-CY102]|uniref:GyrI-like domain-containing protein n=1 Tax=Paenibacillus sp. MMS18-CY102 TaxID=2682849 RepID=UPI001365E65E|nr:GyrI-like domain-containing protein [Paenibacillus sp. MMS18-CY102]MWC27608.1 AraC family transcriptional regulator [Paenibacillus sp. MMS18-CY102]
MIEIIEKQQFSVIGKLGEGLAAEAAMWISPLWQEANHNFNEISNLAKLDEQGNLVGIWGAMSDVDEKFERWKEEGKYLAGCEVNDDAMAPTGWTKWVIPAYKYCVVKCTQASYQDTFHHMITDYLPQHHYKIVGAVHEFFNPKDNNNSDLYLYFPIEKI